MADGGSYTKPQRLGSSANVQNKKNPSKFYSHFLFKALIVTIFLVIIPLFPSEPPDFVSPSIFTRGWEVLHLIFVGIAVSYGLFSRRNDDAEGDNNNNNSKFDNAQSYVTKLLQVSSVFDDEVDSPSGSDDNNINNNDLNNSSNSKIQTWSSQYYRNQPTVVVAKTSSLVDENSGITEKPLLLPVRSLKSRVSDGNDAELVDGENSGVPRVYTRSISSPNAKGFSNNSKRMSRIDYGRVNEENSGVSKVYSRSLSSPAVKENSNNSKRMSRNGSMKTRRTVSTEIEYVDHDENSGVSRSLNRANSYTSPRGVSSGNYGGLDDENSGVSRSLNRANSYTNSRGFSSGNYGDLDDEDMEKQEKKVEESVVLPSPIPWRSRSGRIEMKGESGDSASFSLLPQSLEEMEATRSLKPQSSRSSRSNSSSSSPTKPSPTPSLTSPRKLSPSPSMSSESLAKSVEDYGKRKIVYSSQLPPPPPPPPPPPHHRSRRLKSSPSMDNEEISSRHEALKRSVWSEPKDMGRENMDEEKSRNSIDSSLVGKSVRTIRGGETPSAARKTREIEEEGINEAEATETEKPDRKTVGYDPLPRASFSEFPKETRDFLEQVLVETDDESESEVENYGEERVENAKDEEVPSNSITDEGPDVDQKADEFIAKFREQIRLQRIDSIKRSTGQLKRSSVR